MQTDTSLSCEYASPLESERRERPWDCDPLTVCIGLAVHLTLVIELEQIGGGFSTNLSEGDGRVPRCSFRASDLTAEPISPLTSVSGA